MNPTRMMHILSARMAADTLAKELSDLGYPDDAERIKVMTKFIESEWRKWWDSQKERLGL